MAEGEAGADEPEGEEGKIAKVRCRLCYRLRTPHDAADIRSVLRED